MDSVGKTIDIPYQLIIVIILVAIIIGCLVKFVYNTPKFKRVDEGFFGGVSRGSGHPDSSRVLPESAELLEIVSAASSSDDYRELELILSKLASLKKDLLSPSATVDATKYQAFETAHDRIATAELCALCFSQNIPARDLDIVFASWRNRGNVLLRKLCTLANLKEAGAVRAEKLFTACWEDVYHIAKGRCLKTDFSLQNGGATGRDVGGYEPENLKDLRSYDYKYGGLSASGWNGSV